MATDLNEELEDGVGVSVAAGEVDLAQREILELEKVGVDDHFHSATGHEREVKHLKYKLNENNEEKESHKNRRRNFLEKTNMAILRSAKKRKRTKE